jgi:hypothetical protein
MGETSQALCQWSAQQRRGPLPPLPCCLYTPG